MDDAFVDDEAEKEDATRLDDDECRKIPRFLVKDVEEKEEEGAAVVVRTDEIMMDDAVLYLWVCVFIKKGVCVISN